MAGASLPLRTPRLKNRYSKDLEPTQGKQTVFRIQDELPSAVHVISLLHHQPFWCGRGQARHLAIYQIQRIGGLSGQSHPVLYSLREESSLKLLFGGFWARFAFYGITAALVSDFRSPVQLAMEDAFSVWLTSVFYVWYIFYLQNTQIHKGKIIWGILPRLGSWLSCSKDGRTSYWGPGFASFWLYALWASSWPSGSVLEHCALAAHSVICNYWRFYLNKMEKSYK